MDAQLVRLGHKELYVCVEGSTGTPIVMLHGLGSSTTYYQACNALADLAAQHQVVRYDFDGHGLSPVSKSEALSLDDLVEDLKALVDHLGFPTVGIVGHSMSGLVAMSFAAKYPTLVDRLFLIGPVQELAIEGKAAMKLRASTVRAKGMSAIVDSVVAGATSAHTKKTSPLSLALIRALVLGTPVEGYARACHTLANAPSPDYSQITAQTVIVHGEEDYMVAQLAVDLLKSKIKHSSSVMLPLQGHWNAVENPQSIADLLVKFFA